MGLPALFVNLIDTLQKQCRLREWGVTGPGDSDTVLVTLEWEKCLDSTYISLATCSSPAGTSGCKQSTANDTEGPAQSNQTWSRRERPLCSPRQELSKGRTIITRDNTGKSMDDRTSTPPPKEKTPVCHGVEFRETFPKGKSNEGSLGKDQKFHRVDEVDSCSHASPERQNMFSKLNKSFFVPQDEMSRDSLTSVRVNSMSSMYSGSTSLPFMETTIETCSVDSNIKLYLQGCDDHKHFTAEDPTGPLLEEIPENVTCGNSNLLSTPKESQRDLKVELKGDTIANTKALCNQTAYPLVRQEQGYTGLTSGQTACLLNSDTHECSSANREKTLEKNELWTRSPIDKPRGQHNIKYDQPSDNFSLKASSIGNIFDHCLSEDEAEDLWGSDQCECSKNKKFIQEYNEQGDRVTFPGNYFDGAKCRMANLRLEEGQAMLKGRVFSAPNSASPADLSLNSYSWNRSQVSDQSLYMDLVHRIRLAKGRLRFDKIVVDWSTVKALRGQVGQLCVFYLISHKLSQFITPRYGWEFRRHSDLINTQEPIGAVSVIDSPAESWYSKEIEDMTQQTIDHILTSAEVWKC